MYKRDMLLWYFHNELMWLEKLQMKDAIWAKCIGLHIFYSTYFPPIFKNKYNFVNIASIDGIFYFFIVTGISL